MLMKLEEQRLLELLTDFYTLTQARVVIFDQNFQEVIAYPSERSSFCKMVRSSEKARLECERCDRLACDACHNAGKLYLYRCHAGLTEAVAPIRLNGMTVGYIMCGQILDTPDREPLRQETLQRCKHYGMDERELSAAFDKLRYKSREEIRAITKILETCACYLLISDMIRFEEGNFAYRLTCYVRDHLTEDLSVDTLCRVFQVGRSKLYEAVQSYLGMGIAEYVRAKRLENAARLLRQGSSVSQAAEESGFLDYNYFSKVFKREMGCAPSHWAGMSE